MKFNEKEILTACNAELIKSSGDEEVFGISTDTRTIKAGDIYLPLKGENFDGENFISQALANGAVGYFTTKDKVFDDAKVVYKVSDTLVAYLKLARFCRLKVNPVTVAITGSSGKTTTKEMVYSVLNRNFKTQKTFSNHNNEIGLCQTILTMPEDTQVLTIEMGMRGVGEIELLSQYSEPDFAIITNAGSAHIGRLGSLDNIAKAKSEIVKHLKSSGALIANDNPRLRKFAEFDGEKIWYSINQVQILAQKPAYSRFVYKGKEYELNVEGHYNIENSLSAIELGYKLGMSYEDIRLGLLDYRPIEKRWELENIKGLHFINDSYNANPESMEASVSTFVNLYKNPVVVLGNMGELGENEVALHRAVGVELVAKSDKSVRFLTVGNLAAEIALILENSGFSVKRFEDNKSVAEYILENIGDDSTIFLKASRSMKFEEILRYIREK